MNVEDTLIKVRAIVIIGTIINLGLILCKEWLVTNEGSCEKRVQGTYIIIGSLVVLKKLLEEQEEAVRRAQLRREQVEIERQLEQQFQEIDFQSLKCRKDTP